MSHVAPILPTESFLRLATFLREQGSTKDPVRAIEDAIDYWIENASWKKEDLMPEAYVGLEDRGYTWKGVFLPAGTILRIKYNGSFYYAKVEGDFPIYNGEEVSPNQFALKVTGTARDAWRDLWIKRPTDSDYRLADDLRKALQPKQPEELTLDDLSL